MKIFVYEFVCATHDDRPGAHASRAASLLDEGRAMRDAAVEDARQFFDVRTLDFTPHEERDFRKLADWCDYALIIAPEFDDILATRVRWVEQCGATLLGPNSAAVELCADKLQLAEVWKSAGVPTPPTMLFAPWAFPPPVVVKPRYGAGAGNTFVLDADSIHRHKPDHEAIVQPLIEGNSYSMSFLIGPNVRVALGLCSQDIRFTNGEISYAGGSTFDGPSAVAHRAEQLSRSAIAAVDGLRGYVGVDLLLGQWDMAIEINPRLTTSYIGLREWCEQNLMKLLVEVAAGHPIAPPTYRNLSVTFNTQGQTTIRPDQKR
ncbi:MAG: ATP-grasp domain-containing protein [Gemmataceae bacterium]|nr:ATP-grasp domain-containing protein [Gemmataceae bacterium]